MRRPLVGAFALVGMLATSVALFHFYGSEFDLAALRQGAERLAAYESAHPFGAGGIYFLLYVLISVAAFFPAAIALNLLAGAVFGAALGSVLVAGASATAASLVFVVVRYAFRGAFVARYGQDLARFNAAFARDGAMFVWLVRVTPIFPFAMVNIVMALTPVSLATFFVVSTLGMLPASAAYAVLGRHLAAMTTLRDLVSWQVTCAFFILGALPLASKWLLGRRQTDAR